MPYLVQILLPVYDNKGQRLANEPYNEVRTKPAKMFGGLTAYTRTPAEGLWQSGTTVTRDDIIVVEVIADPLDRAWVAYRGDLERLFGQDQNIVRAEALIPS